LITNTINYFYCEIILNIFVNDYLKNILIKTKGEKTMLKKLLFLLTFASIANYGFGQMVIEKPLPGAPVSTTATNFMKCRILSLTSNPTAPCDIVVNISEASATSYPTCGAILRWKTDQKNLNNPDFLVDLRNGAAYQFNTDGLKVIYDIDYHVFFKYDFSASPKTYSVYARTDDMTELYTMGENLQFRTVPTTSLNVYSVLYAYDTLTTPMPTLKIKDFRTTTPLTFATSVNIGTLPVVRLNQPTQLTATNVPSQANAGVVWKVLEDASVATITSDGVITIKQNVPVTVEAYAVTVKGGTIIKSSKVINVSTGLSNSYGDSEPIKILSTVSSAGIYSVVIPGSYNQPINYNVYSVCGQKINSGIVQGNKINLGSTISGVYMVSFYNSELNQSAKVIIK
jgi:hypothetical protein